MVEPTDSSTSQSLNQTLTTIAFYDKQTGWQQIALPETIIIAGELFVQRLQQDMQLQSNQIQDNQTQSNQSHVEQAKNEVHFSIGIDEVGRGPLYGSVVIAAAILPQAYSIDIETASLADTPLAVLTDSKKLTEKKRERLFPVIKQHAIGYVTVEIPASVIDLLNIFQATMTAMRLSAEVLVTALSQNIKAVDAKRQAHCWILVDGNKLPQFAWSQLYEQGIATNVAITSAAWIKGDARHSSMAAASVLAKVTRDRQVVADARHYPEYQLDKHKGYPTKVHLAAIAEHGVLPQHRRSFAPIKAALEIEKESQ
ncbi:ribonuclease HII [Psychrobacter sp. I-STPA10]|uniref:ribonuclease HII n=1 Tax=Psychrobacter sp. I-STPA10 TaxID=2585769 RepID=UPI001E3D6DC3|nr:ribonuclease HII [Psychrobacter sp. I-STPA10]